MPETTPPKPSKTQSEAFGCGIGLLAFSLVVVLAGLLVSMLSGGGPDPVILWGLLGVALGGVLVFLGMRK